MINLNKLKFDGSFHEFDNEIFKNNLNFLFSEISSKEFTFLGKIGIKVLFKQCYNQRQRYTKYIANDCDVKNYNIQTPIFVSGLPRSGTTYLHNLLIDVFDRDGLHFWELCEPIPYSNKKNIDFRLRKVKSFLLFLFYRIFLPKLQKMHPVQISSYEECWHLFKINLGIYNLDFQYNIHNYGKWISENTIEKTYKEYKNMLKIISKTNNKKKLVLKCPEHMLFHKNLKENFPDCKIIWIHRDPLKVIASYSSMTYQIQKFFLKNITKKTVGEYVKNKYLEMINISIKNRELNNLELYDINYLDLKINPKDTLKKISDKIKVDIKNEKPTQVISNLKKLKSKKPYSPDEFGINKKEVYQNFKTYMDQFNIKKEF